MQRVGLAKLALTLAVICSGCTCQNVITNQRFACKQPADCAGDNVCRGGECRPNTIPPGACFAGETKSCSAITGCLSVCGADGGFQACAPTSGGGFFTNPNHCGECGVQCGTRLPELTCIDARCTCVLDTDCPAGKECNLGGVCVTAGDPCAKVKCGAGEVCRSGTCAAVACTAGCDPGEVCDSAGINCRLIDACRLPANCDGGICEGGPKPDGEACNDGVACTFNDSCSAGSCSGTTYTCPLPNQCQVSVVCAGDGGCEVVGKPDGTLCNDGNDCTFGDSCSSGTCAGTAYTCTPGICASTSACNGDGGCIVTPRNAGAICDDNVACTYADACSDAGFCTGTTYSCPGVTECKQAGVCLGDGGCSVVNKADGTGCDAGTGCTVNDTCASGTCMAGTAATTYQDSDGDGRGNSNIAQTVCPAPAGFVLTGGDCNDSSPNVFQIMSAVQDLDQDGVTGSLTLNPVACVGGAMTVNGRTYYRDVSGAYTWLAAASATVDCNDNDAQVFDTRAAIVTDADHDGYYTGAPASACVGATSTFNGRTYYSNASGVATYLDAAAALGATECNDANATVYRTVAGLYTDVDQDGWTMGAAGSQCVGLSTVIGGRTYYQNTAGSYVWVSSSLGTDCNDATSGVTGPTNWYVDGDLDGVGAGAATSNCTAPAGQVASNTDCNDANGFIHTQRSVYVDVDNDGYTTVAGQTSQCTGNSSTVGGRTYYRDLNNALTWGASNLGTDCDDANNAVLGATNWYLDGDGDGYGLSTNVVNACTNPGGRVSLSGDCNDSSNVVYRLVSNLYTDTDQDGYSTAGPAQQCVGASQTINTRTYYINSSSAFIYTTSNSGTDCDGANGLIFVSRGNLVRDNDRDGCAFSVTPSTQCTGATSVSGGRTYYAGSAAGIYWMAEGSCINFQGNSCRNPDGDDANTGITCN